jgi:hypothetical protein
MPDRAKALEMLRRQIAELDVVLRQSQQDLNAVRGGERLAHWKARTVPLIAEVAGPAAAKRLADKQAGPSFTQDLLEELSDEAEGYRTILMALIDEVNKQP